MTEQGSTAEQRPRRRRATKRELRAWAWVAGALAFAAPWAAVAASAPVKVASAQGQRTVIVRRITRRVIVTPPKPAGVRYVYAAGSGGGSATTVSSGSSGGSGGAPAPTTTSGS